MDGRSGECSGGEAGSMEEDIMLYREEQPPTGLWHLYGQKKKVARGRWIESGGVWRKKLDEYGGKKMIFKMARDRNEDGRDVKRGAVIKDNHGRLITEINEVM